MQENPLGRLSLDFQQSISEVRKLPLSFQYPVEDLNWKKRKKKSYFGGDLTKLALYWLYYLLFSVKAKRRKKWVRRNKNQNNTGPIFWLITAMKATVMQKAFPFCEGH